MPMPTRSQPDRFLEAIPGDSYPDPRLIPAGIDPALGETADDALEETRRVAEYLLPAEDAAPRAVGWSTHPTQDSTQEAEWEQPQRAPEQTPTHADLPDAVRDEALGEFGVDRIVDERYFEDEADDVDDVQEALLERLALADDPHPQTAAPDLADPDTLLSEEETTRGTGAAR
jgi:hypothetical protein